MNLRIAALALAALPLIAQVNQKSIGPNSPNIANVTGDVNLPPKPTATPAAPKTETLTAAEQLSVRAPQVDVMEQSAALKDLVAKYQAQIEAQPEYKAAKEKLDAANLALNAAAKKILDDHKCPACSITKEASGSLVLQHPAEAPPPAATPAAGNGSR